MPLTSPSSGLLLRGHLDPPIVLLVLSLKNPHGLNLCCLKLNKDTSSPSWALRHILFPGSPASSSSIDSETLPACSPHSQHMWAAGPPGEGGLYSGLNHCGRSFFTLLAVINSGILSLHPADFEGEICPWPTAGQPVWDSRGLVRSSIDQELWRLAGLLHIPMQKNCLHIYFERSDWLCRRWRPSLWGWQTGSVESVRTIAPLDPKRIREKYKISDKIEKLFSEFPSLLQAKLLFNCD